MFSSYFFVRPSGKIASEMFFRRRPAIVFLVLFNPLMTVVAFATRHDYFRMKR
jgi:hypothetical protein